MEESQGKSGIILIIGFTCRHPDSKITGVMRTETNPKQGNENDGNGNGNGYGYGYPTL